MSIHRYRGVSSVAYTPSGAEAPEPVRAARILQHPDTPADLREAGLAGTSPLGVAALYMAHLGADPRGKELAPTRPGTSAGGPAGPPTSSCRRRSCCGPWPRRSATASSTSTPRTGTAR